MYIQNKRISLYYKLFAILACVAGQLISYGVFEGRFNPGQLLYYTNLSNILCLVYFILATVCGAKAWRTAAQKALSPSHRASRAGWSWPSATSFSGWTVSSSAKNKADKSTASLHRPPHPL